MQNRMKTHCLDNEQITEILLKTEVGSLATVNEDGFPYVVPVHFVYYEDKIYIHGLPVGQKINNLITNEKVGFEVYDMKSLILDEKACDTNTEYESVIITGIAKLITEYDFKETILDKIVSKYTPKLSGQKLPDNMVKGTGVIEIKIIECTGKYYK